MVAVRVMQPAVDDVVEVIAMRDGLVAAAGAVDMAALAAGGDAVVTAIRIGRAHLDDVLVVVRLAAHLVRMMQVAIVQVVHVVAVADGLVAAAGAVLVVVMRMGLAGLGHRSGFQGLVLGQVCSRGRMLALGAGVGLSGGP